MNKPAEPSQSDWHGAFSQVRLASANIEIPSATTEIQGPALAAPLPTSSDRSHSAGFGHRAQPVLIPAAFPKQAYRKSIREVQPDIALDGKLVPPEHPFENDPYAQRNWRHMTYTWAASASAHKPLYFEEPQLERYGHSTGPFTQPVVSTFGFMARLTTLPYYMGVYPPDENIYDLGDYRPGSCAPYYLDPIPLSVRGALMEGTFATGIPFMF